MEIDKIYITLSSWYSRHLINNALAQSVHLSFNWTIDRDVKFIINLFIWMGYVLHLEKTRLNFKHQFLN